MGEILFYWNNISWFYHQGSSISTDKFSILFYLLLVITWREKLVFDHLWGLKSSQINVSNTSVVIFPRGTVSVGVWNAEKKVAEITTEKVKPAYLSCSSQFQGYTNGLPHVMRLKCNTSESDPRSYEVTTLVPEALMQRERKRQQKEKTKAKRRASGLGRWESHFHVINLAFVPTYK